MSDFYSDFPEVNEEKWLTKVEKDLKGRKIEDALHFSHPIENISYQAYGLSKGDLDEHGTPGQYTLLRGNSKPSNDWVNNVAIPRGSAEAINKAALHHLMNGATGLRIDLGNLEVESCKKALKDIQFEYISATLTYHTDEQVNWLVDQFSERDYDLTLEGNHDISIETVRSRTIQAWEVQATGGNVSQEIAWALNQGHSALFNLLKSGKSIHAANKMLKFRFGIGGNYFFEIAKFRAFRALWSTIITEYNTEQKGLPAPYIEAQTGFVNKSLSDPHTNLLRQTTEALSAILGGVDELTILPYNWYAQNREIDKTQRLATNIGLLLKEESYLDKVIDPSGGSYSIESLTSAIADAAWKIFQELEAGKIEDFKTALDTTAKKRVQLVSNKEITHIGVNKYFNTEDSIDQWGELPSTSFGKPLILEQTIKTEA